MIKTLKKWYSLLVKKSSDEEEDENFDELDDSVAYFNICITKNNDLVVHGDFLDDHSEDMSKLVFLLCSGALANFVAEIIQDKCGKDTELTNKIMEDAYKMILQYVDKKSEECEEEEDNDDEPVIDPCEVFNQRKNFTEEEIE